MKKIIAQIACLFLFVQSSSLFALPVINPADMHAYSNGLWSGCAERDCWLDWFSVRLGFYGDYVFNRRIELIHVGSTFFKDGGDFETVTLSTNAGLVVVDVCDWIEVYGAFGVTNIMAHFNSEIVGNPVHAFWDMACSPAVSYTGGAALSLWRCRCFTLGLQGQYFYTKPNATYIDAYNSGAQLYFTNDSASYEEYQGAVAASYTFIDEEGLSLIPFAGLQFSWVKWNLSKIEQLLDGLPASSFPDCKEQQVVGWTLGLSMILCDRLGVTAEARFANEKALHVNGQLAF